MKIYVVDRGEKVLFHDGRLDAKTIRTIKAEVKWYFGWRRIKVYKENDSIYLMDADRVEKLRKEFFERVTVT
jgi:hypothetical protein